MPYRNGYDVLPRLEKLKNPIFEVVDREKFINLKKQALLNQQCFLEHKIDKSIYPVICNWIKNNYPIKIEGNFQQLAMQMREDLAIHCTTDKKDWLAAAHVCFPSGWYLEDKIGLSFNEVHQRIPDMRLSNSSKLVEAMVYSTPYERYVWKVIFEEQVNGHPKLPKKEFNINNPELWIRYERQTIIGFPDIKSSLFTICQYLIPEADIDKIALKKSLLTMEPKHREYKGISASFNDLIKYLG